jgi:radical SAM protein with 4Fe4S-binding SPASM domain
VLDSTITVISPEKMRPKVLQTVFSSLRSDAFTYRAVFRMGGGATIDTVLECLKAARGMDVTVEADGLAFSVGLCDLVARSGIHVIFLQDGYRTPTSLFANSLELKPFKMDVTFRASLNEERAETLVPWMWLDTLSNAGFTRFEYACQPSLSPFLFRAFLSALFSYWEAEKPMSMEIPQLDQMRDVMQGHPPSSCVFRGVCDIQYAIDADGFVYPCPLYAGNAEYRLGSVIWDTRRTIDTARREMRFIDRSLVHPRMCSVCSFERWCHDGCMRLRSPCSGAFRYCVAYKALFARFRKTPQRQAGETTPTGS